MMGMERVARALQPPPILQGPLVFGNRDQIEALREYEDKVGSVDDPLVEWNVEVEILSYRNIKVMARTAAMAEAEIRDCRNALDLLDDVDITFTATRAK